MHTPWRFVLPATMLVVFGLTCALYRWEQAAWEKAHGRLVEEWQADEKSQVSDLMIGFPPPAWLPAAYYLQLPGLIPVSFFRFPFPLHTETKGGIYLADLLSIGCSWSLVGYWLDRRTRRARPPLTLKQD